MKFRKKIIEDKNKEEPGDIKELLLLARKINVPQFSESFWKIQYNKLYQEWESKKASYRTRRILTRSLIFVLLIIFSIFSAKFFIPVKMHNGKISYKPVSKTLNPDGLQIPYSHTLGIYYPDEQILPLKDFVNYFNYVPAGMQKTIINDILKSE